MWFLPFWIATWFIRAAAGLHDDSQLQCSPGLCFGRGPEGGRSLVLFLLGFFGPRSRQGKDYSLALSSFGSWQNFYLGVEVFYLDGGESSERRQNTPLPARSARVRGGCLAAVGRMEPALRFRRCGRVSSPQHNRTLGRTTPAPDAPPVVPPGAAPMSPAWRVFCGRGVLSPLLHSWYMAWFYISRPLPRGR